MSSLNIKIPSRTAAELRRAVKPAYVTLTNRGKPVAYVLSADIYDEEDIGYMLDPDFWKMIAERRSGDVRVAVDGLTAPQVSRAPTTRRQVSRNGRKGR